VDSPLVWYEGSGTTDRRWLIPDERGSIVAVTNASGTAIAVNSYDEYGIPATTNLGRFQYTGQAWIPELGMYYYKARIYSPTLGRFMQSDSIGYGAGMNVYAYVGGDPVNFSDPLGLRSGDVKTYNLPVESPPPPLTVTACGGAKLINHECPRGDSGARDIIITYSEMYASGGNLEALLGPSPSAIFNRPLPQNVLNCISPSDGPVALTGGGFAFVLLGGGAFSVAHFVIPSTGQSGMVTSGSANIGFEGFVGGFAGGVKNVGSMLGT
jgi:RHS repeat-associated protein